MIDIKSNINQVAKELEARARELPHIAEQGVQAETEGLLAASRRWLDRLVYQSPIKRRQNGKPSYRRTGALKAAEMAQVKGTEGQVFTDPSSPAAQYAARVHNRKPWRDRASAERGGSVADRMRDHIKKGLGA